MAGDFFPKVLHPTNEESISQIDIQISKAKTEIYRIKNLLERHPHQDQRKYALEYWQRAFNEFDKLQAWIASR